MWIVCHCLELHFGTMPTMCSKALGLVGRRSSELVVVGHEKLEEQPKLEVVQSKLVVVLPILLWEEPIARLEEVGRLVVQEVEPNKERPTWSRQLVGGMCSIQPVADMSTKQEVVGRWSKRLELVLLSILEVVDRLTIQVGACR